MVKHTEYTLADHVHNFISIIEHLRAWGDGFRPRLEEILKKKDNV